MSNESKNQRHPSEPGDPKKPVVLRPPVSKANLRTEAALDQGKEQKQSTLATGSNNGSPVERRQLNKSKKEKPEEPEPLLAVPANKGQSNTSAATFAPSTTAPVEPSGATQILNANQLARAFAAAEQTTPVQDVAEGSAPGATRVLNVSQLASAFSKDEKGSDLPAASEAKTGELLRFVESPQIAGESDKTSFFQLPNTPNSAKQTDSPPIPKEFSCSPDRSPQGIAPKSASSHTPNKKTLIPLLISLNIAAETLLVVLSFLLVQHFGGLSAVISLMRR